MKKITLLILFSLSTFLAFGQQADKFAMLGKAGYYVGRAPVDAFYGGFSFEYMFWKRLGVVAGFGQVNGSSFPNKSGRVETRTWNKNEIYEEYAYPNYANSGDLYYHTYNMLFDDIKDLGDVLYTTYSASSVNIGIMVHVLSNENNIIAVSLGGNYSWQLYENFQNIQTSTESAKLSTFYERFAGIAFLGDVAYRRRVYKSFWAGAYLQGGPFASEYDNGITSVGIELSVRF